MWADIRVHKEVSDDSLGPILYDYLNIVHQRKTK